MRRREEELKEWNRKLGECIEVVRGWVAEAEYQERLDRERDEEDREEGEEVYDGDDEDTEEGESSDR